MTRTHANILRAFAAWTVFVWVVRIRNIWGDDRSVGFKAVHSLLAIVSVAFAAACWWVVTQNRGRNPAKRAKEAGERAMREAATDAVAQAGARQRNSAG
jgi:hypothetical protein